MMHFVEKLVATLRQNHNLGYDSIAPLLVYREKSIFLLKEQYGCYSDTINKMR